MSLVRFIAIFVQVTYIASYAYSSPLAPRGQQFSSSVEPPKPDWILRRYDDPEFLNEDDRKAFDKDLNGLYQIHGKNIGQGGMHHLETYCGKRRGQSEELIIKFLHSPVNDFAWGEVKALKVVDDYLDSGMLFGIPAIVMKKKPGKSLLFYPAYESASELEKQRMRKKTVELMCDKAADFAITKYIHHDDLVPGNVLVTMSASKEAAVGPESIELIDWGDEISEVRKDVKKADVRSYCIEKWGEIWKIQT